MDNVQNQYRLQDLVRKSDLNLEANESNPNVEVNGTTIRLNWMNHPNVVSQFIHAVRQLGKCQEITIDVSNVKRQSFPDVITPITAILDRLRTEGIQISVIGNKITDLSSHTLDEHENILNTVWRFSSNADINNLVQRIVAELYKSDTFPKGTLSTLEWAFNEVMDNVIQHSGAAHGYCLCQLHASTKSLAFTVCDLGRGIFKTLQSSHRYDVRSSLDAITLAVQENVTRDPSKGQGNGLFGLYSIVRKAGGWLNITSHGAAMTYKIHTENHFKHLPVMFKNAPGSIVDFKLDYSKNIELNDVLRFNNQVYHIADYRVENLEDENGYIVYKLKEQGEGTGTRQAADRVKTELQNLLLNNDNGKPIILDFSGVTITSSSYIDELLAMLFLDMGLYQFNRAFRLIGMNNDIQHLLHRSLLQRIKENSSPAK